MGCCNIRIAPWMMKGIRHRDHREHKVCPMAPMGPMLYRPQRHEKLHGATHVIGWLQDGQGGAMSDQTHATGRVIPAFWARPDLHG